MVGGRRSERAAKEERIRDDMMGVVRRVGPSIRQLTDFFASVEKIVTAIVLADAGDEDGWMDGWPDRCVGRRLLAKLQGSLASVSGRGPGANTPEVLDLVTMGQWDPQQIVSRWTISMSSAPTW